MDKFIPERWLVDDEHYKRMDRYFMAVYSRFTAYFSLEWAQGHVSVRISV